MLPGLASVEDISSMISRRRDRLRSLKTENVPHRASSSGIGFCFRQPPLANSKKSSPGSTSRFMFAISNRHVPEEDSAGGLLAPKACNDKPRTKLTLATNNLEVDILSPFFRIRWPVSSNWHRRSDHEPEALPRCAAIQGRPPPCIIGRSVQIRHLLHLVSREHGWVCCECRLAATAHRPPPDYLQAPRVRRSPPDRKPTQPLAT